MARPLETFVRSGRAPSDDARPNRSSLLVVAEFIAFGTAASFFLSALAIMNVLSDWGVGANVIGANDIAIIGIRYFGGPIIAVATFSIIRQYDVRWNDWWPLGLVFICIGIGLSLYHPMSGKLSQLSRDRLGFDVYGIVYPIAAGILFSAWLSARPDGWILSGCKWVAAAFAMFALANLFIISPIQWAKRNGFVGSVDLMVNQPGVSCRSRAIWIGERATIVHCAAGPLKGYWIMQPDGLPMLHHDPDTDAPPEPFRLPPGKPLKA